MRDWLIPTDEAYLRERLGSMSQLAGFKRYTFREGGAAGVEAVDVRNGLLEFTVLPGKGMDLAWAAYRGVPFAYMSRVGVVSPAYYDCRDNEWLRTFHAGLLTTCGLSNVGDPCVDADPALGAVQHGLHGRIANTAAENVALREEWRDGEFALAVSGRLREAMVHGCHLTLERTIRTALGSRSIFISDIVTNAGCSAVPLALMYHFNFGYPLLSADSQVIAASRRVRPYDTASEAGIADWSRCREPQFDRAEECFFHDIAAGLDGHAGVAVVNGNLGLGVAVCYQPSQLPAFTQWKMMRAGEYVMALEPGNCIPIGRTALREQGLLHTIAGGERRRFDLEVRILDGDAMVGEFVNRYGISPHPQRVQDR